MKERSESDDLVQDCLERAIRHWHQRRPDGDARTWLFAILHNLAVNRLRQRNRRGRHVSVDDLDEAALSVAAPQEARLQHRDLGRALDGLPEEQRSVLLLVSVEDLSYAEVARVLDIPIGTVMSRLSRARQKLHEALESDRPPVPALRRVK
jgi:RNA polymerase sigma-70 factor (ECF subfamily)